MRDVEAPWYISGQMLVGVGVGSFVLGFLFPPLFLGLLVEIVLLLIRLVFEIRHPLPKEVREEARQQLKEIVADIGVVKCPYCRSKEVQFMQQQRKGFSFSKAVGGTLLAGGVGSLAGFAGKKGRLQWHCKNCGRTFTTNK